MLKETKRVLVWGHSREISRKLWRELLRWLQGADDSCLVVNTSSRGSLYCVGGAEGGDNILASVECYDKTTDTWKIIAPMNKARSGLAAVAFNGRIYATGGTSTNSVGDALTTVERYDPETDAWTELRPLNVARCRHGACFSHGKIYIFGGYWFKNSPDRGFLTSAYQYVVGSSEREGNVEVYDEASDTWEIRFDLKYCPKACTVIAV